MAVGSAGAAPFGGHAGPVWSVAYSPDGVTLASGGEDGTVRLWDTVTGQQHGTPLTGHTSDVLSVAYSPDGATLASGSRDGIVRLWDAVTGQPRGAPLIGHTGPVESVAYSPDGATLASGDRDGIVRLWDAVTGQPRGAPLIGHTHWVVSLAYSPDGATIASGSFDGTILWDAVTGQQRGAPLIGHTSDVLSVAYSPDGATIASSSNGGTVRLWDAVTGQQRGAPLTGHVGWVRSVAYSPDGVTLASGGDDGTIRLWDVATGQQRGAPLTGHTGWVKSVAYSPDCATLASSGGEDGTVRLWDTRTGEQRGTPLTGHARAVLSVAYSPDGATLASGGRDGTVRLWDVATGQQRGAPLTGHTGWVKSVAYGPDGTTLASSGEEGTVRLWDTAAGQQRGTSLTGHTWGVWSVAFSPDGATLASGGQDGTIRLWDTQSGQQRGTSLTGHTRGVLSVAFSPDGATLASGDEDGTIRLWDTQSGQQRGTSLTGHTRGVWSVAYSPDGTILASGGEDGTIRRWDTATGLQHGITLTGHIGWVRSVAYSPDGATIASGGDHSIRIWNARSGVQIIGTGSGTVPAPGRPLAGVRSDDPSAEDLLGVRRDVETLADLVAAKDTSPPLAIALIGDWGAGKSSVMMQMQDQVRLLADMSRNNLGLSAFAATVRQVRFNAWHYSDEHLWASLASHLFQVLAAPDEPDASTAADTAVAGSAAADSALDAIAVRAEQARLRSVLVACQAEERRLTDELSQADQIAKPRGVLSGLGSPRYVWKIISIAVREAFNDIRVSLTVLLSWAVLGAAAYTAWRFLGPRIGTVTSAVAVLVAPVALAWLKLRLGHRALMGFAERQRRQIEADRRQSQADIRQIRDRLSMIDAAARLAGFLDQRGAASAYQQDRGLLGRVHDDLNQLADNLRLARAEWAASGSADPPPLERIVLYIDDLDRCPPRRVVEVLEAVHLMLALDIFVVVVAVDARWLIRSLEYHHYELFSPTGGASPSLAPQDLAGQATPIDYLDKIFQIPYALVPPSATATARYLRSLLPEPAPPAPVTETAGSDAEPPAPLVPPEPPELTEPPTDRGFAPGGQDTTTDSDADAIRGRPPGRRWPPLADSADPDADDLRRGRPHDGSLGSATVPDLRPPGLQLSLAEIDFMTRLAALIPTPRAGKRLTNLYRLARIAIPDAELAAFVGDATGGPYQVVQLLLAILCGHPALAHDIFQRLIAAPGDKHLPDILAMADLALPVGPAPAADAALTRSLAQRLSAELMTIISETGLPKTVAPYQRWCPQLARYSFHTRDIAGRPSDDLAD